MENKIGFAIFRIITVAFIIAITVCVVVDFATGGGLGWSWVPIISIAYAWVILLPLFLIKGKRILSFLAMLTLATLPYLFLLDILIPGRDWFAVLGVPAAVLSVAVLWITFCVIKYLKVNNFYRAALIVLLYGIALPNAMQYFVGVFTGDGLSFLFTLNTAINTAVAVGISLVLVFIGATKKPLAEAYGNNN